MADRVAFCSAMNRFPCLMGAFVDAAMRFCLDVVVIWFAVGCYLQMKGFGFHARRSC